jgi:hypothetical protein
MTRADRAEVVWGDRDRKGWVVRIHAGAEVIKRPPARRGLAHDAEEAAIRAMALETARDDGYDLDPAAISISR